MATAERLLDKVGAARQARRVPRAAVRRAEAAGRDRAGDVHGAQGAHVRRADQRARPRARRRGAHRHGGAGARGDDHDRGHPRDALRARGG